jgi:nitroreductase
MPGMSADSANTIMHAIHNRRSIRKFKEAPVKPYAIEVVIDAARWAPSWTNSQCWRFVVVTQPELKEQLIITMGNNRGANGARQAPVLIIVCAEIGKSGWYKGVQSTHNNFWHVFDVALCMQNLVLAAHSLGLGTCIIGYFDAEKVGRLIKMPTGFEVIAMTPLGYPDETPEPPRRKDLESLLYYNSFEGNQSR